jgi:subtilisin family serine protease
VNNGGAAMGLDMLARLLPGKRSWSVLRASFAICVAAMLIAATNRVGAQAVHDAQWPLQSVDVEKIWQVSRGEQVTVAVIDSGVDASHPDLAGQVQRGADFGDGSSGDGTHDAGGERGHGTQVASLIAATGANFGGDGLYGLAPEAQILPFGVYRNGVPDPSAVAKAVRAAAGRHVQAMVIPAMGTMADPELGSAVRYAIDRDVVVVSGVGADPDSAEPAFPAAIPGVVAVTAVDRNGQVWPQAERGPHVVLAAPGVGILVAASDGTYWTGDDTAFAAAWVAGTVALIRAAHSDWTSGQAIQMLIDTARLESGAERFDDVGFGIVDPLRSLTDEAVPAVVGNPLVSPEEPSTVDPAGTALAPVDLGWLIATIWASLVGLLIVLIGVVLVLVLVLRPRTGPRAGVGAGPREGR